MATQLMIMGALLASVVGATNVRGKELQSILMSNAKAKQFLQVQGSGSRNSRSRHTPCTSYMFEDPVVVPGTCEFVELAWEGEFLHI